MLRFDRRFPNDGVHGPEIEEDFRIDYISHSGKRLMGTEAWGHLGGRVQMSNMIGTLVPMLQAAVELQQFPFLEAPHEPSTKRHSALPDSSITDSGPKVMTATP